jgi:hypothetical protein
MGFYPVGLVGAAALSNPVTVAQGGTGVTGPPFDYQAGSGTVIFGAAETGDTTNRVQLVAQGTIGWSNGSAAADTFLSRSGIGALNAAASVDISTAGKGLLVAEGTGTNSKQGTFTLTGATSLVVSCTAVTANSRIFLTANAVAGTQGPVGVSARTPGTSFTVSCLATDTSIYAYEIFEPG